MCSNSEGLRAVNALDARQWSHLGLVPNPNPSGVTSALCLRCTRMGSTANSHGTQINAMIKKNV